jgi:hypothetical protein
MSPELATCLEVFRRWLHLPNPGHVLAALAAVAANRAAGDPVWLLIVSGPGWGKTEMLHSLRGLPDIHPAATLTEAALLSGTSKRERGNAKGGLLKEIGDFGILVHKDFGSVLNMQRDSRAAVLAALREIYDGSWTRHVGVDGGRTLHWEGKVGLVGGCTPAIDSAHAVMSSMGERFIFYRLPAAEDYEQTQRALSHVGQERTMRAELAEAAGIVLAKADLAIAGAQIPDDERDRLIRLAQIAVRCRSAVERDNYSREIELIPDHEASGRLALGLLRLLNAASALGADREVGWWLITKCALDSMPAIRRRVIEAVEAQADGTGAPDLAAGIGYPTTTARRALEDLAAHGLTKRTKQGPGKEDLWEMTKWARERWVTVPEIPVSMQAPAPLIHTYTVQEGKTGTVPEPPSNGNGHSRVRVVKQAHDYQLVDADGTPMNVGLFVGQLQAVSYAKNHGWEVIEP